MDALRLGERLLNDGLITKTQLDDALAKQKELRDTGVDKSKTLIGIVLVNLGYVKESDLMQYLFEKKETAPKKTMEEELREKTQAKTE
jgi:beta-lactamase regulating signal transducer with metallopeptidase domain